MNYLHQPIQGSSLKTSQLFSGRVSNNKLFEHEHYGPYSYLKIITLEEESVINDNAIGGTFEELKKLRNIIAEKLTKMQPGQTFNIDKDFGTDNKVTAKFFVMADDFDPVSMDELIVSGRQKIVNETWKKERQETQK